jgi:hypothetical protein
MSDCDRADLETNIGAAALEDRARGTVDARAWLERARALYLEKCPASYEPSRVAYVLGMLARAALDRGDGAAAKAILADSERRAPRPPALLALERSQLHGDIALAERDASAALTAFDDLGAKARSLSSIDMGRIALEGRADALMLRGDRAGAADALGRAADVVETESGAVPIGEGRDGFLRVRERSDARRVELLVELGKPEQALLHMRRARARVVASLEQSSRVEALSGDRRARWDEAVGAYLRERDALDRDGADDWQHAASTLKKRVDARTARAAGARAELERALADLFAQKRAPDPPPPHDGELVIALQAAPHGWIALAADSRGVRARSLGMLDPRATPEALSRAILDPLARDIERAQSIAVIASGDARHVDVHALPFEGAPLYARVPVVYPLDSGRMTREGDRPATRRALLVGDPTLDLGGAHAEIDVVEGALAGGGTFALTKLVGDSATGRSVRDALVTADLFHYAGHAAFAGRDGWESALRLAAGAELSIADILAMSRAPRFVVLLGCETARESEGSSAEGLGLAHAFLLAGSHEVVAATRAVDDATTAKIASAMYGAIARGASPTAALREAQILLAQERGDWAAFRAIVP